MDELMWLSRTNTVDDWKRAILSTLERHTGKQCSLLSLMTAAKLQSRSAKHPFNDALTALMDENRVLWNDVPGGPIMVALP